MKWLSRFRKPRPAGEIEAKPCLIYTITHDGKPIREMVLTYISFRHDGVSMEFEDKEAYIKARTLPTGWREDG